MRRWDRRASCLRSSPAARACSTNRRWPGVTTGWCRSASSPLLVGDRLFVIDDGGIAACLDAASGEEIWKARVGGTYSASPIFANGKIWLFDEEGKGTVIEAADEYKVVAESQLEGGCMASPIVSDNALFVRTKTHLYRIEG